MSKTEFILKIKQNKGVRCFAMPVVNLIRLVRKYQYRFTEDSKQLAECRNQYQGKRCFIIGNGPSLTISDLEKLKQEYCFAANGIYRVFDKTDWRPEFYLCVDSFVLADNMEEICKLDIPNIYIHLEGKKFKLKKKNPNIIYINNYYPYYVNQYKRVNGINVSEDVSKYFVAGETVTFNSIQLAIYMGFKEIYLLGVDHRYSKHRDASGRIIQDNTIQDYFDHTPAKDYAVQNVETSTAAYRAARKYCDENGIVIKNLTRGGALEVFERADLERIIGG